MKTYTWTRTALLILAISGASAFAETFHLITGGTVDGEITRIEHTGRITLKHRTGIRSYSVNDFTAETVAAHFAELPPPPVRTDRVIRKDRPVSVTSEQITTAASNKVALGLAISGGVLIGIGGVWMAIAAFAESPVWGIAFILSGGIAELAFMFICWHRAKAPILTQCVGLALLVGGIAVFHEAL